MWSKILAVLVVVTLFLSIADSAYARGGGGKRPGKKPGFAKQNKANKSAKRRGDNRDDAKSGKIDRRGDGNSGQGDDKKASSGFKPKHKNCFNRCCRPKGRLGGRGDKDKGHGNDRDRFDEDNPGRGKARHKPRHWSGGGDKDKGHGNDPDRFDEDNPGKKKPEVFIPEKGPRKWHGKHCKNRCCRHRWGKGDHDRGHGNDPDRFDEDNPGKKKANTTGDKDKGHGNDPDRHDEDNPGKGKGHEK